MIWKRIIDRRLREEIIYKSSSSVSCHFCCEAGDGETPGDAEGTAHAMFIIDL